MDENNFNEAIKQLNKIVSRTSKKKIKPEVWYLLYVNNEYLANYKKSEEYKEILIKNYPHHKLTNLLKG